jgi:hypothetical protein
LPGLLLNSYLQCIYEHKLIFLQNFSWLYFASKSVKQAFIFIWNSKIDSQWAWFSLLLFALDITQRNWGLVCHTMSSNVFDLLTHMQYQHPKDDRIQSKICFHLYSVWLWNPHTMQLHYDECSKVRAMCSKIFSPKEYRYIHKWSMYCISVWFGSLNMMLWNNVTHKNNILCIKFLPRLKMCPFNNLLDIKVHVLFKSFYISLHYCSGRWSGVNSCLSYQNCLSLLSAVMHRLQMLTMTGISSVTQCLKG